MQLYIVRHGIAIDREDPKCPPDPERFLTPEGVDKAKQVAKGVAEIGAVPDLMLSSPYVRAFQTAEIFATALEYTKNKIQKTELLVPGNIHQHPQPVVHGQVQKPLLRNVIDSHDVRTQLPNLGKVTGGLLRGSEKLAGSIWCKRAVRHALDVKFLFAQPEELAIHAHAQWRRSHYCHAR